ncbi:MAG: hypothetical protein K2M96_08575 [Prevotella sp.]|nr:hypothetical protein [Prevotella sp.]
MVLSCADRIRTMHRRAPHHVPTRSAPCTDTLRTVCRWAPHDMHRKSADSSIWK